jgi:hypothetical protein
MKVTVRNKIQNTHILGIRQITPFGNDDNDPNAEKNKEEFWNFNGDDGEEEKEEEEED